MNYKIIGLRFLRGAIAGALGAMVTVQGANGNWTDFSLFINKLVLSGVVGFLTGGILAADKVYRFK